ncbi:methyltransferase [Bacillus haynesii]|uniref:methyltransferase n=1 Tax=Bacillus haynesii TaxID=1925021 RepID=UPI0015941AE9|nr:methyltransferase [Bacillus haynesii]NVB35694.1 methyltransferase [Bacillus licheniformis]MCY7780916.1 methyltransferase [Bacillus haynesii]MCY7817909.1 methyltransferase [Bacillus haynesii]MCY8224068.1 methyltransferase [Bacillus haynesii]MCY8243599.1 methyltransferase [Bacillus haynesii]
MFNKKQIDKLLEENKGEPNEKFGTGFIAVFYISILLSICTFFIEYKYFLIVLFAPTIIVMLINPPFSEKKGVFRFIAGLYLLLLALATYFWLQA